MTNARRVSRFPNYDPAPHRATPAALASRDVRIIPKSPPKRAKHLPRSSTNRGQLRHTATRPFLSWTAKRKTMEQRNCSCLVKTSVRVRRRGETRRVEAETWRRVRRSLKPDGKATVQVAQRAIARRRVRGHAGRRKTCAYARNISLLRIVFPTVRISDLPCTAERLPLGGQAFSPSVAAILPRPDSIPLPYHKSFSPCSRFFPSSL